MRIRTTPTYAQIEGRVSLAAMVTLQDTLRYREPGYFHDPRFKWHKWDGWQSIWHTASLRFPAGLTDRVVRALVKAGVEDVEIVDDIGAVEGSRVVDPLPDGTQLYPDQAVALRAALAQPRGLMELATNFGKTELMAAVCAAYGATPVLVLTPQRTLVHQTVGRLRTLLQEPVESFGRAGYRPPTRVVVSTVQALAAAVRRDADRAQAYLQRFGVLLADEAHTISVVQWFPVLGRCPAPVRLGLSGSLEEARIPLLAEAYFGPVFHTVGERFLIQQGRSARADVIMPYAASAIPESQDFDAQYVPMIVRNDARNALLVEMLARGVELGWPGLALFFRHEHGNTLHTQLASRGVAAALAHGGIPAPQAERAVRNYAEGRSPVLLAGHAYAAGIDLPRVRLLVNAGAWKSQLVTRQKTGRGLRRKTEGENRVVLADPYDLGNRILKRHAEARRRLYAKRLTVEPRVGALDDIWNAIVEPDPVTH